MIPLMQQEVVDRKRWIGETDFVETLAVAQSVPGPIALNTAIFVGLRVRKKRGCLCSSLGIILPSFIIILLIALFFSDFKENPVVERIFKGIRPAVVALIAAPLWKMGKSAGVTLQTLWIPFSVALVIWQLGLSPIYVIILTIVISLSYHFYRIRKKI